MMFPNILTKRATALENGKQKTLKKTLQVSRDALLRMAELRSPSNSSLEELHEKQAPPTRVPFRLREFYDVIPRRLAFTVHSCHAETEAEIKRWDKKAYLFSSDLQDRFEPYCADFGPVKLSIVYTFCNYLQKKMSDPRLAKRKLVYYCDDKPEVIANTAFLLGCYAILNYDFSPEQASAAFSRISPSPIPGFRDATHRPADYTISLMDCFQGLKRAMELGWYSQNEYDLEEYEHWDAIENGDLHEVTPKFLAFRGPVAGPGGKRVGHTTHSPESYVPVFKEKGVSAVVRLNNRDTYDKKAFTEKGIRHYDIFFEDCRTPSPELIKQFLDICDHEEGRIAVHCMAGLGRTGTMIALWMMKKLSWKANEAIAWLRIVRPGCVIGDQQHFLKACEGAKWDGNTPLLNNEASEPEHAIQDSLGLQSALKARASPLDHDSSTTNLKSSTILGVNGSRPPMVHDSSTTNLKSSTVLGVNGSRRPAITNRRAGRSLSPVGIQRRLGSGIRIV